MPSMARLIAVAAAARSSVSRFASSLAAIASRKAAR